MPMKYSSEQKRWYALYTTPRAEKKVAERFERTNISYYLPLQKKLKKWSDRKKWVEEPLFKSYIFVNISEADYFNVLNTYGVVKFVTFSGQAVPIPEREIDTIKKLLMEFPDDLEVVENIEPGTPIEVIAGPMMGVKGELVEYRGEKRAAIKVEYVNQIILVNIPSGFITRTASEKTLFI